MVQTKSSAGDVLAAGERLHALDSLRASAMLLGIVLHAAASLALIPFDWPVRDVSASLGFDALLAFIHLFRMQLFFFLAGFFAHLMWRRLGTRGFVLQRAQRIGIPLMVGLLVLVPLILWLWKWADSSAGAEFIEPLQRNPTLLDYPTFHLWFLEMLLMLYLLALGLAQLGKSPKVAGWVSRIDGAFDWLMRQPFKPALLMLPTAALLWTGPRLPEIDLPGIRLFPTVQAVAYYALFFGVGWWLQRRSHLLEQMRRWIWPYFAMAFVAFMVLGGSMQAAASPGAARHWLLIKLTAVASAALYAWCMTFAVTGLFLRIANGHRPWARYLADASYWWYLCHLPIVIFLQICIAAWPLNGWLKLLLILGLTVAILLPSYHFLVRYTAIGRVLNGARGRG